MTSQFIVALACASLAAGASVSCNLPASPASAEYSTRVVQVSHRSGVNDFAAKWAPVKGATGYRLCWDTVGVDRFTEEYVKATTCVTLNGADTVYNNGEQTAAGPRDSNRFQNVRVAAINKCGVGPSTKAQSKRSPMVAYVCSDSGEADMAAFADSVTLITRVDTKRTATGTVAWAYANKMAAPEMVCLVQARGDVGVTVQRECFVAAPGTTSSAYSVALRPDTVLLTAEVRRLGTCIGGYDVSNTVEVPQLYVPFGSNVVNKLKVCLVAKDGKLVYGSCKAPGVVKTVATVDEFGAISGEFKTADGQCVAVKGSTVALGECAEGAGWMAWKENSYKDYAHQYIRSFPSNMCMPFGTENTKNGKTPKLIDCTALANM